MCWRPSSVISSLFRLSSGNVQKIRDDSAVAKITLLISVPRIFNRLNDNVNAAVAQATQGITEEAKIQFIQKAVFGKIRMGFGGHVRVIVTGSAPINPLVHEQIQKIMECPMIEGYGQT